MNDDSLTSGMEDLKFRLDRLERKHDRLVESLWNGLFFAISLLPFLAFGLKGAWAGMVIATLALLIMLPVIIFRGLRRSRVSRG